MPGRPELVRLARVIAAGRGDEVPSPCVSICRMDPATSLCEGCCRTIDEIAAWSRLDAPGRRAVWRRIGERALEHESDAAPSAPPAA